MKEMIIELRNFLYNKQYSHYNYCYCYNYPAWIPLAPQCVSIGAKALWLVHESRPLVFLQIGFLFGSFFFFLITAAWLRCPRGSLVTDGRDFSHSVLHEIKNPSGPEPRSTSARCHSVLVSIKFKSFGDFAALRVSLRWSSKTLKRGSDLVRVQRDKSVYALYIIWWMVMVMLRININSNLMNEWINEWVN